MVDSMSRSFHWRRQRWPRRVSRRSSVDFTPVADIDDQDAQRVVLNVAEDSIIADPIAPVRTKPGSGQRFASGAWVSPAGERCFDGVEPDGSCHDRALREYVNDVNVFYIICICESQQGSERPPESRRGAAGPAPVACQPGRLRRAAPVLPAQPQGGSRVSRGEPAYGGLLGSRALPGAVVGGAVAAHSALGRSRRAVAGLVGLVLARRHAAQPRRSRLHAAGIGVVGAAGGAGARVHGRPGATRGCGGGSPREAAGRRASTRGRGSRRAGRRRGRSWGRWVPAERSGGGAGVRRPTRRAAGGRARPQGARPARGACLSINKWDANPRNPAGMRVPARCPCVKVVSLWCHSDASGVLP